MIYGSFCFQKIDIGTKKTEEPVSSRICFLSGAHKAKPIKANFDGAAGNYTILCLSLSEQTGVIWR